MRAAVIGMGVVGSANARTLRRAHEVVPYDAKDGAYPAALVASCDFAVICVGTPAAEDGSCDLSALHDALGRLPAEMPVLVRSTIPPGTMDALARPRACHAPEFMHERAGGPWHESSDVPFLILGGDPDSCAYFRKALAPCFPSPVCEYSALEAELAKYTANLHWAARVVFVNEMAAISAAFGADWENVRDAWLCDTRVSGDYTAMDGFAPGFGGRCWPKDLSALIAASEAAGHPPEFLKAVQEANRRLRDGRADV